MWSAMITQKDIDEIREFLESDNCNFVNNMTRAGLSFGAMALVIQGIEDKLNEVEKALDEE